MRLRQIKSQAAARLRAAVRGRTAKFRSTSLRSAALIRDWYPTPSDLKNSNTSASRRIEVSTLVGVACGPRPRLSSGVPSMSSVHAGLSGSGTLAEVVFGNLAVVVRFMFFCLSQRYDVSPALALRVHHHDHFTGQQAKTDLAPSK